MTGPERYNLQVSASQGKDVLLADLEEAAFRVTGVPPEGQRIIFKGKQLSDSQRPLFAYGVKSGSKLMVMGNKNSLQKDPRYIEMEAVEESVGKVEVKQNQINQELEGIEQGYLDNSLVQEALQKLQKRLASCHEEFVKLLETLDSLSLGDGPPALRTKRKGTVQRIQKYLDVNDTMKSRISEQKLKAR
ncbi:BAG family molecular chaperone regulator 1 [Holothuria leucospilota]|uniref:BAG family molecular chaperone regulator 1 n=1 Tax=Holothuria leucospilota TaxID=206669 RepID=A0A9Q1C9B1_HOLLE|nr:BAG family molecular chaperone regulator 1 [Holothuria leucospilota]